MQRPGFNSQCIEGVKARWGYCNNCPNQRCQLLDSEDSDAAIGIGLAGQSTIEEMGAGWTGYFASGPGTCSSNSSTFKRVWVSVEKLNGKKMKCSCYSCKQFIEFNCPTINITVSIF